MAYRFLAAGALLTAALAQTLSFEVASVKPAPTRPAQWRGNRPGADRIDFQYATLWYCISYAYGVKSYQMSGPDWLKQEYYDIAAKAPAGATRDQLPAMMQALLAERFKLRLRHETRDLPTLSLVVGKDGPKLKEAAPESGDGRGGAAVNMSASPEGGERMEVKGGTMTTLVNTLTGLLGIPVVDQTGLTGRYDFALDYSRDQTAGTRSGGGYNEPPAFPPPPPGAEPGLSVYSSIQRLGLKLEARKTPMDTIVIESAEKAPVEN